ncbi:hypothetical protein B9Z55_000585 [Caenorhabditis nigoni]|uniref:V-type proton ATPase subunit G n=1 Tax=Caenorhabditis nigoni TaxID=1611254 RepID=A0A2G5VTV9_9PELO|nr:hypothetical protein B9Z55_000585 [Caenorhabditis nigoni]
MKLSKNRLVMLLGPTDILGDDATLEQERVMVMLTKISRNYINSALFYYFEGFKQQYLGNKEDIESKIRRDTEDQTNGIKQPVVSNKQAVIVRLLQLVCDIKPELHHNLTLQKKFHGPFVV